MPDQITHIRHSHADYTDYYWCGRKMRQFDFYFHDIDHAAYNAKNGGRLLACHDCVKEVQRSLHPNNVNGSDYRIQSEQ